MVGQLQQPRLFVAPAAAHGNKRDVTLFHQCLPFADFVASGSFLVMKACPPNGEAGRTAASRLNLAGYLRPLLFVCHEPRCVAPFFFDTVFEFEQVPRLYPDAQA
jgi:hypothetical protein